MPAGAPEELIRASRRLAAACGRIRFHEPVRYVYNPLEYASGGHDEYLRRFGGGSKRVVFLGMNPGPWGMAQTGVPFGEVASVRDWMGVSAPVRAPRHMHPRVPVTGFDCPRSEVSGCRLWGLMRNRFGSPRRVFPNRISWPITVLFSFWTPGRNMTPDKLSEGQRGASAGL